MTDIMYFEDFNEGYVFEFDVAGLTAEEIISFASQYDPQRFHLSEDDAAKTHFGGLVASGFQTQLLCFRPFCDQVLLKTAAVGAPGIDNLKWMRPWYPGENLSGTVKLLSKRPSAKKGDRGYLNFKLEAAVNNLPTLSMDWTVIMLRKPESK
jgi:acyl dehydratase